MKFRKKMVFFDGNSNENFDKLLTLKFNAL